MAKERVGADLLITLTKLVKVAGTPDAKNGARVPRLNHPMDAAVLEYAVAKTLKNVIEKREEAARREVLMQVRTAHPMIPATKTTLHNSAYATLIGQEIAGPRRLNKDALLAALLKRMSSTEADEIMEEAQVQSEPQVRLTPTINLLPDDE